MLLYESLFTTVKSLKIGEEKTCYKNSSEEVYVLRPTEKFKNYDIDKNFQIYIKINDNRFFRPNHLLVMIDLNLRVRGNPEKQKSLATLFDKIFYKKNYKKELDDLKKYNFSHFLYNIEVIVYIYTLFLIEQEYNYPDGKSKYNPKTLFLHGWVREFIYEGKEIDNMIMSLCRGQPPKASYTFKDNKNNTKYDSKAKTLWYFKVN